MAEGLAQLSYAMDHPTLWRRMRRWWPALTALALAVTVGTWLGPRGWRHARVLVLQDRATGYAASEDLVAHTKVETTGRDGVRPPTAGSRSYANNGSGPAPWSQYVEATGLARGAVVFLGERRSPIGNARIVHAYVAGSFQVVTGTWGGPDTMYCAIGCRVLTPAGIKKQPAEVGPIVPATLFSLTGYEPLNVYAATTDPADPGRFTFDIRCGSTRETVDGYLADDDTVRLVPRNPAAASGTVRELQ